MGIAVQILGASGAGKSASLRSFKPDEIGVIGATKKPLPFKSDIKVFYSDDYDQIDKVLKQAKVKSIVIDDSQYLMANEFMRRANEKGYQKFTDIGRNFWLLHNMVTTELPDDVIVYFLHHTELDANGEEKAKTIGKMLDEKITVEGLFSIVLKAQIVDGRHIFTTVSNGMDPVKTPMGMFDQEEIENDLKMVDDAIRDFYGIKTKPEKAGSKESKPKSDKTEEVKNDKEQKEEQEEEKNAEA